MSGHKNPIYVFGEWRLDPAEHVLSRNGSPIPLTPKVFDTLQLLVENAGRLVTKEEFMKRVWPDAFVEDLALVQNISQIRKALAQPGNSENGSMIETVPKRGYRFVAPVQVLSDDLTGQIRPAQTPSRRRIKSSTLIFITSAIVVAAGLAVGFFLRWHKSIVLASTDRILVTDFENKTGDPAFDAILKRALVEKLNESPYLNLVPDSEVLAAAKEIGAISRQTGLAVCNQVRARAVLVGTISSTGANAYKIILATLRCGDGDVLAEAEAAATSQDEVLSAIGLASDILRKRLGEIETAGGQFHTPMAQATTNSLAALKAFSSGEDKRSAGQEFESIPYYKMAIDLDPNFALAYARLGIIYENVSQTEMAAGYLQKAFDLRDHATERERLYIAAHYYDTTGEEEKHIEVYRLWHELYSRDVVPANNISFIYLTLGQPEKAVEMARVAMKLSPDHAVVRVAMMNAYTCNGQYTEAKALYDETVQRKLDAFGMHLLRYTIAAAEDDEPEMQKQLEWAHGNPRENSMLEEAGSHAAARGQLRAAHELFQRAQSLALKSGSKVQAGHILLYAAESDAALGFTSKARAEVQQALPLLEGANSDRAWATLMLNQDGAFDQAERISSDLQKNAPLDLSVHRVYLPTSRSAAKLKQGNPEAAIAELQIVQPYDLSIWSDLIPLYLRGMAHLSLHHNKEAIAQFETLIAHQSVVPNSPYLTLAHLGLARAYIADGQKEKAGSQYDMFFKKFAHADADLPLMTKTKTEYSDNKRAIHH